jgi:hypothetical protein
MDRRVLISCSMDSINWNAPKTGVIGWLNWPGGDGRKIRIGKK